MLKLGLYILLIWSSFNLVLINQPSAFAQTGKKVSKSDDCLHLVVDIKDATCAVCLRKLEKKIAKIPGVTKVSIESPWDIRVPENIRRQIQKDGAVVHIYFKESEITTKDLLESIKTDGFRIQKSQTI